MCNELLKKAVRFHFYDICGRNIYTTLQFPVPRITICVQLVPKRMKQPRIIRCLVILARSNFPFAYNAQFIPDPIELYAFKRDLERRSFSDGMYACRQNSMSFSQVPLPITYRVSLGRLRLSRDICGTDRGRFRTWSSRPGRRRFYEYRTGNSPS